MVISSYPGSSPAEKRGESLEELIMDHVPRDVHVLCVVLIIELLPTQSILSVSIVGVLDP